MLPLLPLLLPLAVASPCSAPVSLYKLLVFFPHCTLVSVLLLLWTPSYKLACQSLDTSGALWSTLGACQDPLFVAHVRSSRLCCAAESQPLFLFLQGSPSVTPRL